MRTSKGRSPSTRAAGAAAERRARRHYRLRGYRVLAQNARAAGYEIDLILRRGQRVIFCEVKQKSGEHYGDPAEMVTPEKQRRLRRAAEAWLAGRRDLDGLEVTFDVVALTPRGLERIPDAL
jgi:putative endonuclease